jgi:subtilisin-like proprotein convertase family protein
MTQNVFIFSPGSRLVRGLAMGTLVVAALAAGARSSESATTYSNTTSITIPDSGAAPPYPSTITVPDVFQSPAGNLRQTSSALKVTVTLTNMNHTFPNDLDILLVGPNGDTVILMSDVGGGTDLSNVTLTFDDGAATGLGSVITSGTYKPTNSGTGDTFAAPAPPGTYGTTLSVFRGQDPAGPWSLYVVDDAAGDLGSIAGGWSLTIQNADGDGTGDGMADLFFRSNTTGNISVRASNGASFYKAGVNNTADNFTSSGAITIADNTTASPYPSTITVPAFTGDVNTFTLTLTGLTHTNPDDLDILLVSPTGQKVVIMSDAGGTANLSSVELFFEADGSIAIRDESAPTNGTIWRNANHNPSPDTFPASAPAGPYGRRMFDFLGRNPSGTWKLFIVDDAATSTGSLASWTLNLYTNTSDAWSYGFVPYNYDVYYADVNGDGHTDLISRHKGTGSVEVFRAYGNQKFFQYNQEWSYGWGTSYDLYFADVNGDDKADLIGRNASTGDVNVFLSTGTSFSSGAPSGLWSYGWSSGYNLYFADVNGDGKKDLVSRYFGPAQGLTGNIYVSLSTGTGFASPTLWTYGFSAGYDLYFADVTGDGKADLVARYYGPAQGLTGNVYVMASDGSAFVWNGHFDPWTYGWGSTYDLAVKDFTGDGLADIAGRHTGNGDVYVATSTGTVGYTFTFQGTWATGMDASKEMH